MGDVGPVAHVSGRSGPVPTKVFLSRVGKIRESFVPSLNEHEGLKARSGEYAG